MIFNSFQLNLANQHCKSKLINLGRVLNVYSGEKATQFEIDFNSAINNNDVERVNNYIEEVLKKELKNQNIYMGLRQYIKRVQMQESNIDIMGKLLPTVLIEIGKHKEEIQQVINKRKEV